MKLKFHDFSAYSFTVLQPQANLTGSPLCHVNIYKSHSNGASDTNFMFPGTTNQCCLETWLYVLGLSLNFAYHRTAVWLRLNCIYSSCAGEASVEVASDSESCWPSCRGSGLWDLLKWPHPEAISLGPQSLGWLKMPSGHNPTTQSQSTCTYGNFCRCACVCVYMACMYTLHACMCGVCVLVCVCISLFPDFFLHTEGKKLFGQHPIFLMVQNWKLHDIMQILKQ